MGDVTGWLAPQQEYRIPAQTVAQLANEVRTQVGPRVDIAAPTNEALVERTIGQVVNEFRQRLIGHGATEGGVALLTPAQANDLKQRVRDHLFGLGPLQELLDDPTIENIDVNGADNVWISYSDGRKARGAPLAADDNGLIQLVQLLAHRRGVGERQFDMAHPELDLRLPDGSRLSAVMGVCERPAISIRRHRITSPTLWQLVALQQVPGQVLPGMLTPGTALLLDALVKARKNILVAGPMNVGKTTLLRALGASIPPSERIVTIEQALELGLDKAVCGSPPQRTHPDCVALEARPPSLEGTGEVTMRALVRRTKRMNANRVIVGEVLGAEIIDMLTAMIQGRTGSMGTIHADSATGTLKQACNYAIQAPEKLTIDQAQMLVAQALDVIVYAAPVAVPGDNSGRQQLRMVDSVIEVLDHDRSSETITSNRLTELDTKTLLTRHIMPPRIHAQLRPWGYDFQRAQELDQRYYTRLQQGDPPSEEEVAEWVLGEAARNALPGAS